MNTKQILIICLVLASCHSKKALMTQEDLFIYNYQEVKAFFDKAHKSEPTPDVFPKYPYGLDGVRSDLSANLIYPEIPILNQQEGVVIVNYIIEKDGSIGKINIEKSVSKELDSEAVRVIKGLKRWHPGYLNEKPVRVQFHQPVKFKLE